MLDIETHQPVDLLPDRTTATVARWLAEHPGVEVICRDRSTAYAEAGRLGAPDAVHVADRWHIWSNLAEAVEKTVVQHRALLREPQNTTIAAAAEALEGLDLDLAPAGPRTTGRLSDRVREQHEAVHALLEQGIAMREISRRLGLARNTVRRYAHAASADELLVGRWTGRTSILDPYKPHLHQRWAEGCTVARRLFKEVRERGYPGGENVVKVYAAKLRADFPPTPQGSVRAGRDQLAHPPSRPPHPRPGPAAQSDPGPLPRPRPNHPPRPRVRRADERPPGQTPRLLASPLRRSPATDRSQASSRRARGGLERPTGFMEDVLRYMIPFQCQGRGSARPRRQSTRY